MMRYKPERSYVCFDFEITGDIPILLVRECGCGCGYIQVFTLDDERIDCITRDNARFMYE